MFNELIILQSLLILTLFYFISTFNIVTLWYLAGIYLVALGWLLLLDDGDIFIGFLWVIDLGVGLVFFIFILHYSTFLYQKSNLNKTNRELMLILLFVYFFSFFFYFFSFPLDNNFNLGFKNTWFYYISFLNYTKLYKIQVVSDLNLLREIFFYLDSLEFFIINFMLLFGIISSILLTFLVKRIFNFLNFSQLMNLNFLKQINNNYFIRNQNYLKQQLTSTGTRVWLKKKNLNL